MGTWIEPGSSGSTVLLIAESSPKPLMIYFLKVIYHAETKAIEIRNGKGPVCMVLPKVLCIYVMALKLTFLGAGGAYL